MQRTQIKTQDSDFYKDRLIEMLSAYKKSRSGLFCGLSFSSIFRNHDLTREKIKIANEAINLVKNFEGSSTDLHDELCSLHTRNAEISRIYNKHHFNLDGYRPQILKHEIIMTPQLIIDQHILRDDVRNGESAWRSGLADVLLNAIGLLRRHKDIQFKNSDIDSSVKCKR